MKKASEQSATIITRKCKRAACICFTTLAIICVALSLFANMTYVKWQRVDLSVLVTNSTEPDLAKLSPSRKILDFYNMNATVGFPYLQNYRSPCWYQKVATRNPYAENWFWKSKKRCYMKYFGGMSKKMRSRIIQTGRRLRCLPLVYQIGVAKSGTTDLYFALTTHPYLQQGGYKEPRFWTAASANDIKASDYIDLYDRAAMSIEKITSPNNRSYHPAMTVDGTISLWISFGWKGMHGNEGLREPKYTLAHYIQHVVPKAKIILVLRHPAERLYSDYCYFNSGRKTLSPQEFHGMVLQEIQTMQDCLSRESLRICAYSHKVTTVVRLQFSLYFPFVRDWVQVFPTEQFKIVRLEDYKRNESGTANEIYRFLGLPPHKLPKSKILVKNRKPAPMLPGTRKILNDFYRPYNVKLAELLNDKRFVY